MSPVGKVYELNIVIGKVKDKNRQFYMLAKIHFSKTSSKVSRLSWAYNGTGPEDSPGSDGQ